MDSRFRNIESEMSFEFSSEYLKDAFDALDNYDLDHTFIEAVKQQKVNYTNDHWTAFKANEADLVQDSTFAEAANELHTPYQKSFWTEAEQALFNEGLQYEYKSQYWKEAERLLIKSDRKSFFYRWASVASIFILVGLISQYFIPLTNEIIPERSDILADDPGFNQGERISIRSGHIINSRTNLFVDQSVIDHSATENNGINQNDVAEDVRNVNNLHEESEHNFSIETSIPVGNKNVNTTLTEQTNQDISSTHGHLDYETIERSATREFGRPQTYHINKILPREFNLEENRKKILDIPMENTIFPTILKNTYNLALHVQAGIGNPTNSSSEFSNRNSVSVEFSVIPKRLSKFSFGLITGFVNEDLKNLEIKINSAYHNERTGSVDYAESQLIFGSIIRLNAALKTGYRINHYNRINLSFGYERYATSNIQLVEYSENTLGENKTEWGINSMLRLHNFNLRLGYEKMLTSRLAFTFESKFSLNNRINFEAIEERYGTNYAAKALVNLNEINDGNDITAFFGLKYSIFGY